MPSSSPAMRMHLESERMPRAERRTRGRRLVLRLRPDARARAARARARGRPALRHLSLAGRGLSGPRASATCSSSLRRWIRAYDRPATPRPLALSLRSLVRRLRASIPTATSCFAVSPAVGQPPDPRARLGRSPAIFRSRADRSGARASHGWSPAPRSPSARHAIAGQERQVACDSNRIWKVLGCGGFYLGAWQPGSDEFAAERRALRLVPRPRRSRGARGALPGRARGARGDRGRGPGARAATPHLRPSPPAAARGAGVTRSCSCGTRTPARR